MPNRQRDPVKTIPPDETAPRTPDRGIAICLSGGGYRAMLFHVGALWRLQELGFLNCTASAPRAADLGPLARVSSVSGGSITAAMLALKWDACRTSDPDPSVRRAVFEQNVVAPIRAFSQVSIAGFDASGVLGLLGAIVLPGSVNDYVIRAYRKHLYGDATLQDLPDEPRFVINASNLQSGAVWRFMKPYIRDWRVGEIRNTRLVPLAQEKLDLFRQFIRNLNRHCVSSVAVIAGRRTSRQKTRSVSGTAHHAAPHRIRARTP